MLKDDININKIVIEALDRSLSILGNQTKDAIYATLEEEYNLKKEDIPKNIEVLEILMSQMFGIAAGVLKKEIIRQLKNKFEANPIFEEASIVEIINMLYVEYGMAVGEEQVKPANPIDVEQ